MHFGMSPRREPGELRVFREIRAALLRAGADPVRAERLARVEVENRRRRVRHGSAPDDVETVFDRAFALWLLEQSP